MSKELFVGTFVHSLSLQEFEVSENSVIGVQDGKIAFVEKNVKDFESLKSANGFEDAKVFVARNGAEADMWVGDEIEWKSIFHPWLH